MIRTRASCASTLVACLAWGLQSAPVAAERWKAPNPTELALTAPAIDKDADAEILEWDVRVVEEYDGDSPLRATCRACNTSRFRRGWDAAAAIARARRGSCSRAVTAIARTRRI